MVAGSTTPTVVAPLPVHLPTTGSQPAAPHWKTWSGAPGLALSRRYQVAVAGSKTPMRRWPSPFQSPVRPTQPGAPYWKVRSVAPALLLPRRYQVAVPGSKVPTVEGDGASLPPAPGID